MADKKISELTDGTSLQSGDDVVIARSGANFKVDPTQFGSSIDVTGTVTADGLTVDGAATLTGATDGVPVLTLSGNNDSGISTNTLRFFDSDFSAQNQQTGRIEFYGNDSYGAGVNSYIQVKQSPTNSGTLEIGTGEGGVTPRRFAINPIGDIFFYEDTGTNVRIFYDASAEFVVNQDSADFDFRVGSDTNTHALFVDAGNSRVGINESTPTTSLHVTGTFRADDVRIDGDKIGPNAEGGALQIAPHFTDQDVAGGDIDITTGGAGTRNGGTGKINIFSADSTNQASGSINLTTGNNSGAATPGGINLTAGNSSYTGGGARNAGSIVLTAGDAASITNTNKYGGSISLRAGYNSAGAAYSGDIRLQYYDGAAHQDALLLKGSNGSAIFNDAGSADADFRVESDTDTHAFFVDAGNDRVGIATSAGDGKLSINHNFATTSRLLSLTSGTGVAGGVTGTVYGIYAQVKANNDASEVYGAYFDVNQGSNDDQTGVYAEVGPVSGSNKRGIGLLGSVTVNTDTTGQNPLDRNNDAVVGVFAEALGANTSYSSKLSALSAVNSSTYGETNYGALIQSAVPTTPASTNSIPLRVYYGSDILLDVRGNGTGGDSETVVNQSGIDHDFRVESDTDTHAFFVDAGNSRVGIGTSSPSNLLEVSDGSGGNTVARFTNTAQANSYIQFNDTATLVRPRVGSSGDNLILDTANTERMRIDSSGNVGIGTDSPATNLDISQFGGTPTIRISNSDGTFDAGQDIGKLEFYCGDQSTPGERVASYILSQAAGTQGGGDLQFATSANAGTVTERMRIDSSGNLLVGTTDTAPATNNVEGICLRNEGHINVSRASGVVGYFNRKTDDGIIVDFRKDGASVGSIGTLSGENYIGNANTDGILFGTSGGEPLLQPMNAGVKVDGQGLIGSSSNRWKDLYLSGGVYLGGTGAANKLEDYEEGTFTPAFSASTTSDFTHASASGSYTKIGRLVYVNVVLNLSAVGISAGRIRVSNLPFTIADVLVGTGVESAPIINFWGGVTNPIYGLQGVAQQSTTYVELTKITGAQTDLSNDLNVADIDADLSIRMTMVYQAA